MQLIVNNILYFNSFIVVADNSVSLILLAEATLYRFILYLKEGIVVACKYFLYFFRPKAGNE